MQKNCIRSFSVKKILIVLVLLVLAVFIGAPYVTGKIAQNKLMSLIEDQNTQYSQLGLTEVIKYDRGFRSSETEFAFQLEMGLPEFDVASIDYSCDLTHGVISVAYKCKLANKGEFKTFLDTYLGGKDPIFINGDISAFGKMDQTILVDPVKIQFDDGSVVDLPEKVELDTIHDFNTGKSIFDGELEQLVFEAGSESLKFEVNSLNLEGQFQESREGLYVGNASVLIDNFQGEDEQGQLSFDKLKFDTATIENDNTVSTSLALKADTIKFPSPQGDIEKFSAVSFDLGIYGMDADALVEYSKVSKELQQQMMASANSEQPPMGSMMSLIPAAEKLMKQGFGFNVKSNFQVDESMNSLALDVSLVKDLQFSEMMTFLFAPDEALQNFRGMLDVQITEALLEKYPQLSFMVSSLPFFEQADNGFSLQVRIDSGLFINGEATSIAELQGMF